MFLGNRGVKFMQMDGRTTYYYFWRFYFRSVYPVDKP
jgi:hypothetical protein